MAAVTPARATAAPARRRARPTTAADAAAFVSRHRWLILLGLITAAVMEVLDTTIINVALPQMAGNLGATQEEIGWVATGYILSNVVVLPMTAFFTERFGRQRYLTASIILFIVASFFCGTSHSLAELVLWRILQGAGGAALLSTAQATIRQIFPREQQGMVQAIFMLGIIVAPTLGPTLGGWITDNYTWNWCFFINVPIGIVVGVPREHLPARPARACSASRARSTGSASGCSTVGVGSLQYVLEEGNQKDWFADPTDPPPGDPLRRLPRRRCSGGSSRRATSTRSSTSASCKNRDARRVDLPLHRARLRALRRRVHLSRCSPRASCGFSPTETGLA